MNNPITQHDMVHTLHDIAHDVAKIQEEKKELEAKVLQLQMQLSDANGQIGALASSNVDLTTRLVQATEDSTYFREKVGVATSAATDLAQKMVQIISDVERKPKPMISLEDIERQPKPTPINNGPRHQINLTSKELLEIASMPEGVEFTIAPEPDLDRVTTKTWYRNKLGHVPNGYRFKREVILKRVNDRLEFVGFRHPSEERRSVQPESQPLPPAPNIPPAQAGSVGNDRLGGTDAIPAFLARGPANGGEHRADITDTSS
jgi:hypothetical protein